MPLHSPHTKPGFTYILSTSRSALSCRINAIRLPHRRLLGCDGAIEMQRATPLVAFIRANAAHDKFSLKTENKITLFGCYYFHFPFSEIRISQAICAHGIQMVS